MSQGEPQSWGDNTMYWRLSNQNAHIPSKRVATTKLHQIFPYRKVSPVQSSDFLGQARNPEFYVKFLDF